MGLKISIEPVCSLEKSPVGRYFRIARPVYGGDRVPFAESLIVDAETGNVAAADVSDASPGRIPEVGLSEGSIVVPGFHDAHNHWFWSLFRDPVRVDDATSADEVVRRVKSRIDRQDEGWILAVDWNTARLSPGAITIDDLDRASKERPVLVFDASYHGAMANSAAMARLAPAFAKEPDLQGTCRRGLLTEDFVVRAMACLTADPAELRESVRELQREFFRHGVTSLDDLDLLGAGRQLLELLLDLYGNGNLRIPCRAFVQPWMVRDGVRPLSVADGRFQIVGVKDYADGSFGSWTAALCSPYHDDHGGSGIRTLTPERFARRLDLCRRAGFDHFAVHAIGDQGILDAIEALRAAKRLGVTEPHHLRIEHFEIPSGDALHQARDLGLSVCSQPNFLTEAVTYAERLGGERAGRLCPHDEILRAGIPLAFGSDGMPHPPLFGLASAVLRDDGHAIPVGAALHAYTAGAQRVSGAENVRGGLRPGMEANFAVLSEDVVRNPSALRTARILQTWLRGVKVYDAAESPCAAPSALSSPRRLEDTKTHEGND